MTGQRRAPADLVSRIPELRAFAMSLCRSRDQSDDLIQDTLLSAWSHLGDFKEGTNMGAWLSTILRNRFIDIHRKGRTRREIIGSNYAKAIATAPGQDGWAISTDLRYALEQLPAHQRRAVLLVGAEGLSIAEAAAVCKCETGTIKSRVSRARKRLSKLLSHDVVGAPGALSVGSDPRAGSMLPPPDRPVNPPDRRTRAEESRPALRSRLSSQSG